LIPDPHCPYCQNIFQPWLTDSARLQPSGVPPPPRRANPSARRRSRTSFSFLCYLAYLLLALLQFRLRPLSLSPEQALDHLQSMYKVYLRDPKHGFQISRVVTLSKKQETILKTIDRKLLRDTKKLM
jgi:hypothetical protein